MSEGQFIPTIPESAPFTLEQRAYLNGFFAGLFSRAPVPAIAAPAKPLQLLTILFGSQTGNAENLARRAAKQAGTRGFAPVVHDMAKYPVGQLALEKLVLVICSTYGDGDPPDNARSFWEFLRGDTAANLPGITFSVCALGDSNYPHFCAFGKAVDARLERLGATRLSARMDCDADYERSFDEWLAGVWDKLAIPAAVIKTEAPEPSIKQPTFGRTNPFPARLLTNRRLNAPGSSKDVRHLEIALEGSGLSYEAGDALAVVPQNDPTLVAELLVALGANGDEAVSASDGASISLREALTSRYEITRIPQSLLEACAAQTGSELLRCVASPAANGELTKFLCGREIIDLLTAFPTAKFTPQEFIGLLRKLQPRLYSISSSPKANAAEVHLTVSTVRYESLGRARKGVCSTFLAERVQPEMPVPIFVHQNKSFRPPGPETPLIMIGPGTGIAPFRAFLQERRALGATGKSWLFFGDQKSSTDFLYREEIEASQKDGLLTRLDLAWSRDQAEKIYVQHRMLEHAKDLYAWLEEGASVYVCGDAARMAKDVDAALHKVIEIGGGKSQEDAGGYVAALRNAKRYQRDVY